MNSDSAQFDDSALKGTLRRIYAFETAPPALREKVAAMLARGDAPDVEATPLKLRPADAGLPGRARARLRRMSYWGLAAAALVLLGTVGLFYAGGSTRAQQFPDRAMLASIFNTHDCCCRDHPDHHLVAAPKGDLGEIGRTLSRQLGHPVFVANLSADGWEFKGAAVCAVGGQKAAHLVYKRDNRTISVFSLQMPQGARCPKSDYVENIDRHTVAGFFCEQRAYCMVGCCRGGKMPTDELRALMAKHRSELVGATQTLAWR